MNCIFELRERDGGPITNDRFSGIVHQLHITHSLDHAHFTRTTIAAGCIQTYVIAYKEGRVTAGL
ncbi:hypothetical protein FRC11_012512, partial [Ceratobasidium sp. 423]